VLFCTRSNVSDENDRKKRHFNPLALGWDKSVYEQSETNILYIKEKCEEASVLFTGAGRKLIEPTDYTAVSKQDMFRANDLIKDAENAFDDPVNHPQVYQVPWQPEHKRAAYQILRETREACRYAAQKVGRLSEVAVEALIDAAWKIFNHVKEADPRDPNRTRPGEVFDQLKEAQAKLRDSYLPKGVRDDLRQKIQDLWDAVKEYMGEQQREYEDRQRARAERQAEFEQRNREWRDRQEGHIARWTKRVENQSAYIASLEGQIEDLQDKLDGARNGDFADKVRGWIDEKREKIRSVQTDIDELTDKINDVREKLDKDRH
jgi:DNA repair exonuclease SbcCD ATPase subunit